MNWAAFIWYTGWLVITLLWAAASLHISERIEKRLGLLWGSLALALAICLSLFWIVAARVMLGDL